MYPQVPKLALSVPMLAVTMTASLLGGATTPADARVPKPERRPAGSGAPGQRLADPCERSWRPRSDTSPGPARGLARPAPTTSAANAPAASGRPNIVTIMVDDMRTDDLSGPWMRHTRSLIAQRGATFENSFAPYPLCGPARASFLTGQYSHNHGVRENSGPSAFKQLDDSNTLATWLNSNGGSRDYNTAFLGKYINGYADAGYVPPGWDTWHASIGGSTQNYRGTKLSDNGAGVVDLSGQYQSSAYGTMGAQLVSDLAKRDEPFYFNLSFSAPHSGSPRESDDPPGIKTPARLAESRDLYDDQIVRPGGVQGEPCNKRKPRAVSGKEPIGPKLQRKIVELRRQRAEALTTVDAQVRKVMQALRKSGELANTYVIFTSDNGFFLGEFRQRFGKKLPYEPSLRTPTLVRGPGIASGIKRRAPFTSIDFAPTIADMANVGSPGPVDGVSMLREATGRDRGWKRAILTDAGSAFGNSWYARGVRAPGLLYALYHDSRTRRELFDIDADPHQNHNVLRKGRYRETLERLKRDFAALRDCAGRECRRHW
ncbi:MAG: sulfatase family protein [Nocardioidaceae bacterium]